MKVGNKLMSKDRITNPVLVDTALLGRGLSSLDNSLIKFLWPSGNIEHPYSHEGVISYPSLGEILEIRNQQDLQRLDSQDLKNITLNKKSGYLTASAIMEIALPFKIVVTAGIGGITGERVSKDLVTIANKPLYFISSGFKDIIEAENSLAHLKENGVRVFGWKNSIYDGFLFGNQHHLLDGLVDENNIKDIKLDNSKGIMIFNPLPSELKFQEDSILKTLKETMKGFQESGIDFHPLINELLDQHTKGKSSFVQLLAFIANINLAQRINNLLGE
ncbi:MAG TPA: pseudouridine-5'-phosphate glycosidase [Syntrophomonadaceae bacterium]|nr:pseudouridine-5'-phosphate glycosidase [Syntrophomonadaceae bacterium]